MPSIASDACFSESTNGGTYGEGRGARELGVLNDEKCIEQRGEGEGERR